MGSLSAVPSVGIITFESEGNNDPSSIYFSRRAHVPSDSSGVTIGRGYDMKHRLPAQITQDLMVAGVSRKDSILLAGGSQLIGESGRQFIRKQEIKDIVISEQAQLQLFEMVYSVYYENAQRICTKKDVTNKYGVCEWSLYSAELKDLIADLIYRGDYTPSTRVYLQPAIISEDPVLLREALRKIPNVPRDRAFRREMLIDRMIRIEAGASEINELRGDLPNKPRFWV